MIDDAQYAKTHKDQKGDLLSSLLNPETKWKFISDIALGDIAFDSSGKASRDVIPKVIGISEPG